MPSAEASELSDRIAASGSGPAVVRRFVAADVEAMFDVPGGQPPLFAAAETGNLGQGILMFVAIRSRCR